MEVSPNIPLKGEKKIQKNVERVLGVHWEQNLSLFQFKILRINNLKKSENRYKNENIENKCDLDNILSSIKK
jgi:hypothetical protein